MMRTASTVILLILATALAVPASAQYRGREASEMSVFGQGAADHTAWGCALGAGGNFAEGRVGVMLDLIGFSVLDLDGSSYLSLTPIKTTIAAALFSLTRKVGVPLKAALLPTLLNARLDYRLNQRWKLILDNRTDFLVMNESLDSGVSWRPGAGIDLRTGAFHWTLTARRHVHWNWDGADVPSAWGVGLAFGGGMGR